MRHLTYINLYSKPTYLFEINPLGRVPVLLHNGRAIPESEDILAYIDKIKPDPPLHLDAPVRTAVGVNLFASCVAALGRDPNETELKAAFNEQLRQFDRHLLTTGWLFLAGNAPSAADCQTLPQLYQIMAAGSLNGLSISDEFAALHAYIQRGFALEAFKKTVYNRQFAVNYWKARMQALNLRSKL